MLESISLPLCGAVRTEYGGWSGLREELARLGCGGIEAIWAGEDLPADFPPDLLGGWIFTGRTSPPFWQSTAPWRPSANSTAAPGRRPC